MEKFSVVGQPGINRVDAPEKATGQARFTCDIILPRMLVGRVLRSPHPHARILRLETTRARALPGVKAVITAADAPHNMVGRWQDDEVLAATKVHFVGDHVAAVAAVDEDTAEEAMALIEVEYEPLLAVMDAAAAMLPDAPRVHDDRSNIADRFSYSRGDVDDAFARADLVFQETIFAPGQNHAAIEPFYCLASFEASGRGQVWAGVKDIFGVRRVVADCLMIPENDVRVFQSHVGGCFGGKGTVARASTCAVAALLSRATGLPVKLINTRDEEILAGRQRLPMHFEMKFGVKADGKVIAKETRLIANTGACVGNGKEIYATAARRHESIYRFKNIRTEAFLVYTHTLPGSPFRGYGNPQGTFAVEMMMDIAAEKLGLDPVEIRLKNATRQGDVTAHGWEIKSCGLTQCIETAAKNSAWHERRANSPNGAGLGIGCMIHASGRRVSPDYSGSRAMVKIERDGRVTVFSGEGELGQGSHTVFAMMAAEELGIPIEDVKVAQPDTDISPIALGLFSDRGTILGGNAVRLAAQDARRQLLRVAAEMLEAKVEDLLLEVGRIFVQGYSDKSLTVAQVAGHALARRDAEPIILGKATYEPPSVFPDPKTLYGNLSSSYSFAAQVAEVEVDRETGLVKTLKVSAAHDLGKAINPMGAHGQMEGAIVQGIGYSLYERMAEDGDVAKTSLLDYRIPTSLDVPTIESAFIETIDPYGPYGAKGVGEPGLVAMAPAVANAIYNTVGVRITELPITPDKLLAAMERS
ncbi:MAG: xanthine dehydrogenase family protein molybdopterin-binding subunit [Chloroflexi bacterium]|nr:xanthine dehydrogenase family protein molybdopterin-binding subunit [Chloroflexota bacterium]